MREGPLLPALRRLLGEVLLLLLVVRENSFTWIQVSQLLEESWTILTTPFDLVAAVGPPLKNQVAISHSFPSASSSYLGVILEAYQMREDARGSGENGLEEKQQQTNMALKCC